ncbi:hypothetical protein ACTG9Q_06255 [Actinokineospora sp. 24-640]
MLYVIDRPISVPAWLGAPLVFAASVLGITAAGGLLVHASWAVALSSALGGASAAVAAALAKAVTWSSRRQRLALAVPYPVALLGAGLALDGVALPTPVALGSGIAATSTLLGLLCLRSRAEPVDQAARAGR